MISGNNKKNVKQIKGKFERNIPETSLKNFLKYKLHPSISGVRIGHFYWILGSHLDQYALNNFGSVIHQATLYRKTFLWYIPKFKWISGITLQIIHLKMKMLQTIF